MGKTKKSAGSITNRRARFDYELSEPLVAGLQLTGAETKALRLGFGQLHGAFITVKGGELWLVGARIASGRGIEISETNQYRDRKLLAKRQEIQKLIAAKQQGLTIVPLELLTKGRYIKVRIAAGRGKKRYDKRETIKRRQQEREIARLTKS